MLLDVEKILNVVNDMNPNKELMLDKDLAEYLGKDRPQITQWKCKISNFVKVIINAENATGLLIKDLVEKDGEELKLNIDKILSVINQKQPPRQKFKTKDLAKILEKTPTQVSLYKTRKLPSITKVVLDIEKLTKQPIKNFIKND